MNSFYEFILSLLAILKHLIVRFIRGVAKEKNKDRTTDRCDKRQSSKTRKRLP